MAFGFVGKIARIDLKNGKVKKEPIDEKTAKRFVGCVGYAAKILWDELKAGTDPLGPENKLIMATGPLTGTLVPNSGSYEACFKSPLTGAWGETRSGGRWGSWLKYAGYDMLILEGKSENPVYITILDGEVEIKPADKIWGKTVPETEDIIKEEIKTPEASVASIGVAGEKQIKIACIMNDLERAAGRCGGGAVMGSKNVKAIAAYGHGDIAVAEPEEFMEVLKKTEETIMKHPGRAGFLLGTIGSFTTMSQVGDLPTKYGWSGHWDKAEEFYDRFLKTNYIKNRACWTCMLGCGRYSESKGKWPTIAYGGPEYETAGVMGAFCFVDDPDALIRANYLCNIHGLDTISAGHMVAFGMQCYEKRLITKEDTDGVDLRFGNAEAMITMLERIAKREGFGDVLAEGIRGAAQRIGKNAIELALQVKGLDMPMHDPRSGKSLALQYGTANRGMCHTHPDECHDCETLGADWDLKPYGLDSLLPIKDRFAENRDKAFICKLVQDFGTGPDMLGTCKFPQGTGFNLELTAALLSATTGWKVSDKDLLKLGERVNNLQRCFNIREGIRRKDDMIPPALKIPHATGTSKGSAVTNYEAMLDDYYDLRGWDKETGIPTRKTLIELDLSDIADDLAKYVRVP